MITTIAVYENGILKPSAPLKLAEGQTVQLRIDTWLPLPPLSPPTPEEEAFAQRMKASMNLEELLAVLDTAPPPRDDFDIVQAINETRRQTGFRMPDPKS